MRLAEDHPATHHLVAIDETAELATRLVARLLATGRRHVETPRRIDPVEVLRGLERILARIAGGGVQLSTHIGEGVPQVVIDPVQLEQVVINLVENARDAVGRRGRVRVELDAVPVEDSDEVDVRLRVSDDGPGITATIRDRLFDPFCTTKEEGEGMGLGLATVQDIVERAAGVVEVESKAGSGATFSVLLPAATSVGRRPTTARVRSVQPASEQQTVLVVDDEAVVRTLLRSVLRQQGYRVVPAEDGPDALGLCAAAGRRPDLLLTDIVMPGMNGVELADHLAAELPDLRVIFMSGYTDELRRPDGSRREDVRFLAKPFRIAELVTAIGDALGRRGESAP